MRVSEEKQPIQARKKGLNGVPVMTDPLRTRTWRSAAIAGARSLRRETRPGCW